MNPVRLYDCVFKYSAERWCPNSVRRRNSSCQLCIWDGFFTENDLTCFYETRPPHRLQALKNCKMRVQARQRKMEERLRNIENLRAYIREPCDMLPSPPTQMETPPPGLFVDGKEYNIDGEVIRTLNPPLFPSQRHSQGYLIPGSANPFQAGHMQLSGSAAVLPETGVPLQPLGLLTAPIMETFSPLPQPQFSSLPSSAIVPFSLPQMLPVVVPDLFPMVPNLDFPSQETLIWPPASPPEAFEHATGLAETLLAASPTPLPHAWDWNLNSPSSSDMTP